MIDNVTCAMLHQGLPLYDNKTEVDEGKVGELDEVVFFFSMLHRALPET